MSTSTDTWLDCENPYLFGGGRATLFLLKSCKKVQISAGMNTLPGANVPKCTSKAKNPMTLEAYATRHSCRDITVSIIIMPGFLTFILTGFKLVALRVQI
jgi:hypothetical protein